MTHSRQSGLVSIIVVMFTAILDGLYSYYGARRVARI